MALLLRFWDERKQHCVQVRKMQELQIQELKAKRAKSAKSSNKKVNYVKKLKVRTNQI